jgi:hypothetical protein
MDWSYTEEQQEIRQLARKILEDLATHERLREIESSETGIDSELYAELGRSNLLGVAIEEAFGGSEMGFLSLCVLLQEIGRTVAPVPIVASLGLGGLAISEFGSDAHKQRWLPGLTRGEVILTAGLIEAGSDDPARPRTAARRDGDGWRLDGCKICVPAAHLAERILVPARVSDTELGVFLLDPSASGVELQPQLTTNRERHSQVELANAWVDGDDLLGDLSMGTAISRWITDRATIAYCMLQLGVSERALEMTAEYAGSRQQFGRPIGSFQAVHIRAGDAFIDVEAMRLTALHAAWRLHEGLPDDGSVAIAKFWAADGGHRVGYACQHLHGGIGIDIDYPLHRYYLWAKQLELTLGSAAVALTRLGEEMAREPAA